MTYWPREVLIFKEIFEELRPKNFDYALDELRVESFDRVQIIGVGNASPFMVSELYNKLKDLGHGERLKKPMAITKYGHGFTNDFVECLESGHPLCDKNSFLAGEKLKRKVMELENDELLILCLSGGASALAEVPIPLFSPEEICAIHCEMLLKGADIVRMNQMRGEFSQLKNGGLGSLSGTSHIMTYAISDVPVDDFAVIGSGPTSFTETSYEEVAKIATQFIKGDLLEKVLGYLESRARINFLSMKRDLLDEKEISHLVLEDFHSLREKVLKLFQGRDSRTYFFEKPFNCSLDEGIERHLARMKDLAGKHGEAFNLFSGGELTFEVKGDGKGGRNTEFILRMTKLIFEDNVLAWPKEMLDRLTMASVGTDGTDGVTSAAGAWINYEFYKRGRDMGLDIDDILDNNDSYSYFDRLQSLVHTGPTETNVMDLRYISLS